MHLAFAVLPFAIWSVAGAVQAAAPCPPVAFAKGVCGSIKAEAPAAIKGLTTTASGFALDARAAKAGGPEDGFINVTGRSFQPEVASPRAREPVALPPSGVPSVRPLSNRPAVVVPLLNF